ncbi:heme peroxidase [Scenedesmus sp. NREL 46B-D3]|nr:heme peroxidase [Scenedesmus sp. NREL 46B-D3]
MGLPPAKTFSDITPDPALAATLQQLYGNVSNVDAYVGGLSEPHFYQAHVGQLFYLSIKDQFARLRDGDWWYFENAAANELFSAAEVDEVRRTSLRDLIIRNTNITDAELPQDIWTAVGAGSSCANPSSAGGTAAPTQQRLATDVLNGQGHLEVSTVLHAAQNLLS